MKTNIKKENQNSSLSFHGDVFEEMKTLSLLEAEKGNFMWEGFWLNSQQISALQNCLNKKNKIVFIELLIFLLICTFLLLPLYGLTLSIVQPHNSPQQTMQESLNTNGG